MRVNLGYIVAMGFALAACGGRTPVGGGGATSGSSDQTNIYNLTPTP